MFDIHYDSIKIELTKTNNLVPIKVKIDNQLIIAYISKISDKDIWGINTKTGMSIKLFPNKFIDIISIGSKTVQSLESYNEEYRIYKEVQKEKRLNYICKFKK